MNDVAGTINDLQIISAARAELAAGRPVALASLLATAGSMPRHEGARMLALSDGSFIGTVGGGNIEFIAQAREGELLAAARFKGGSERITRLISRKRGNPTRCFS